MELSVISKIFADYELTGVSKSIAPDDVMYNTGAEWYWSVGESGLKCVLYALSMAWTIKVKRVLDLPCGHGRVGRYLRAAFPEAEMFGCDLSTAGVDFCASTLNMKPIYSKLNLTEVELPDNLDVIWVGSLFTHLDEERTTAWLSYLAKHLAPHGVLVATFHGQFTRVLQKTLRMIHPVGWEQVEKGYAERGYGYAQYTEYDLGDFGLSVSKPAKIVDTAAAIPDMRILYYSERMWANNHDVLALTRNERLKAF